MSTITTTREFDKNGTLIRETVVEITDAPIWPVQQSCLCVTGVPTYCPLHGYSTPYPPTPYPYIAPVRIWCSDSASPVTSNVMKLTKEIA